MFVIGQCVLAGKLGCVCENAAYLFDVTALTGGTQQNMCLEAVVPRWGVVVQGLFNHVDHPLLQGFSGIVEALAHRAFGDIEKCGDLGLRALTHVELTVSR